MRSSRDDRTMDLHSLPAIMELLSIISIITHNGLGGLFVPPLQKAASEARHVTRASEHSLFAAYMLQSDPGPHYRKMSKLLVLLQLRFQTSKYLCATGGAQSQALSLGLLLSIHHKTKRFSFLCPSIKCGLLHYNDVIYFISYNDALLVAFNKPKHSRNRVPLPEIIIVVSGDYFLCGAPHQITAQIRVGLIFSSGLSCLRRVHFSSRRIRLK